MVTQRLLGRGGNGGRDSWYDQLSDLPGPLLSQHMLAYFNIMAPAQAHLTEVDTGAQGRWQSYCASRLGVRSHPTATGCLGYQDRCGDDTGLQTTSSTCTHSHASRAQDVSARMSTAGLSFYAQKQPDARSRGRLRAEPGHLRPNVQEESGLPKPQS